MSVSEEQHVSSKLVSGHGKIERPVHVGDKKKPSSLSYSIAYHLDMENLLDNFVLPTSDKKNSGETAKRTRISLPDGPMPMPITGAVEDIDLSKARIIGVRDGRQGCCYNAVGRY